MPQQIAARNWGRPGRMPRTKRLWAGISVAAVVAGAAGAAGLACRWLRDAPEKRRGRGLESRRIAVRSADEHRALQSADDQARGVSRGSVEMQTVLGATLVEHPC